MNRNAIPDDPRSVFVTSGLRVGTAAETTAGMGENEFVRIADLMVRALRGRHDETIISDVRDEVREFCGQFNPYRNFTEI